MRRVAVPPLLDASRVRRREGAVTLFEPWVWSFVAGFVGFALAKKAGFAECDDEDDDA